MAIGGFSGWDSGAGVVRRLPEQRSPITDRLLHRTQRQPRPKAVVMHTDITRSVTANFVPMKAGTADRVRPVRTPSLKAARARLPPANTVHRVPAVEYSKYSQKGKSVGVRGRRGASAHEESFRSPAPPGSPPLQRGDGADALTSVSPQLTAEGTVWYLPSTEISDNQTDPRSTLIDRMMTGAVVAASPKEKVDYIRQLLRVVGLHQRPDLQHVRRRRPRGTNQATSTKGDVIFGLRQGAVVASEYKRDHPDQPVTYVLVENRDQPTAASFERFNGLSIPLLGVTANSTTPPEPSRRRRPPRLSTSRPVRRLVDFPAYPLNFVADAAIPLQAFTICTARRSPRGDAEQLAAKAGETASTTSTTRQRNHVLPDPHRQVAADVAVSPGLCRSRYSTPLMRRCGRSSNWYDRSDYGKPTTAGIVPSVNPVTVAPSSSTPPPRAPSRTGQLLALGTFVLSSNTSRASSSATLANCLAGRHASIEW